MGLCFDEKKTLALWRWIVNSCQCLVPRRWKSGWSNYYGNNKVLKFFELKEFWIYMVLISHTCSRLKTWCIQVTFICELFALENNSCFQDQNFASISSLRLLSRQFEISMKLYQCRNGELMRSKSTRLSLLVRSIFLSINIDHLYLLMYLSFCNLVSVMQVRAWTRSSYQSRSGSAYVMSNYNRQVMILHLYIII